MYPNVKIIHKYDDFLKKMIHFKYIIIMDFFQNFSFHFYLGKYSNIVFFLC